MNPQKLEVLVQGVHRLARDVAGMRVDFLGEAPHLEGVAVVLRVEDVVSGDRRAVEIVGEHLAVGGEFVEPRGVYPEDKDLSSSRSNALQFADTTRFLASAALSRIALASRAG
jgi:hypothetical protein